MLFIFIFSFGCYSMNNAKFVREWVESGESHASKSKETQPPVRGALGGNRMHPRIAMELPKLSDAKSVEEKKSVIVNLPQTKEMKFINLPSTVKLTFCTLSSCNYFVRSVTNNKDNHINRYVIEVHATFASRDKKTPMVVEIENFDIIDQSMVETGETTATIFIYINLNPIIISRALMPFDCLGSC